MGLDQSFIGRAGGRSRIVIERGPVANFARAVKDDAAVYTDEQAAKDAGFDAIPVPPTFAFVAGHWGTFAEIQPTDPGVNPVGQVIAEYHKMGGLIHHGEQAFTYHRQIQVGDVLDTETTITDVYDKESGSSTMTFAVAETTYTDAATGEVVLTTRSNFINRH